MGRVGAFGSGSPLEAEDVGSLARVHRAAIRCHELRRLDGDDAAREVVRLAGEGDAEALGRLGIEVTVSEAQAALEQVTADLKLLSLDNDPDLDVPPTASRSALDAVAVVEEEDDEEDAPGDEGGDADAEKTATSGGYGFSPNRRAILCQAPLALLPFEAAEALRWLAWHTAWHTALVRAAASSDSDDNLKEVSSRAQRADEARGLWMKAVAKLGKEDADDTSGLVDVGKAICLAAAAIARHTSCFRVAPRAVEEAKKGWCDFEAALQVAAETELLQESLLEEMRWLLWNAAWHAANAVAAEEDDDEEDEDEEDDEDDEEDECELFGEDYPGSQDDAPSDLTRFLKHSINCHWDPCGGDGWRGLVLPLDASEHEVHAASEAGFNTVRVRVAPPAPGAVKAASAGLPPEEMERVRGILTACAATDVWAVLDFSAFPHKSSGHSRKHRGGDAMPHGTSQLALRQAAAAARKCDRVCGVVLPRGVAPNLVAPLAEEVRGGGLTADRCAIVVPVGNADVLDDDCNYAGPLKEHLEEDEGGTLVSDGHIVLEVERKHEADSPQGLLDEASHAGENFDEHLPPSVASFSVAMPGSLKEACGKLGSKYFEELAARHEAGCYTSHGWFAHLAAPGALGECLGITKEGKKGKKQWAWPCPHSDRVLWPHGTQHTVSMIYLHGFTCDGNSYLNCAEYFYWEEKESNPQNGEEKKQEAGKDEESKDDEDDDEDEDEDEELDEVEYNAYPGLKVIFPTAPKKPVSCYHGELIRRWYDYLTDHDGKAEDELDLASLEETTHRMHKLIDEEVAKVGAQRVFLGGASQGCCVALHVAATYKGPPLGGIVGTQGHLLTCTKWPEDWASRGTPVRIYNGLADEMMPWDQWVSKTYDPMRKAGGDVQFFTEDGVDHGDDEAEGRWVRNFLAEVFPA